MDHKELDVTERLSTPAHELPNLPDECGRRKSPKALPLQSYHWHLSPVSYEWQFPNGFPTLPKDLAHTHCPAIPS